MARPIRLRELAQDGRTWSSGADVLRVGRLSDLEIVLDDSSVSKRHAEIRRPNSGMEWEVIDCGSTNGTYFNGDRIGSEPRLVRAGDLLQFGAKAVVIEQDGVLLDLSDGVRRCEMSEASWLNGDDPIPMLNFVRQQIGERKLRLFCCACVQAGRESFPLSYFSSFWDRVLDLAYRLGDNLASNEEVSTQLGRLNGLACSKGCVADTHFGYGMQSELLAQPFVLSRHHELALVIGADVPWMAFWVAPPSLLKTNAESLRDVFGNPFHTVALDRTWLTSSVTALASDIYNGGDFGRMPMLASVLEDAGCQNEEILAHCRQTTGHVRGCWLLDLLTARND